MRQSEKNGRKTGILIPPLPKSQEMRGDGGMSKE
jgi:hypothetical protein